MADHHRATWWQHTSSQVQTELLTRPDTDVLTLHPKTVSGLAGIIKAAVLTSDRMGLSDASPRLISHNASAWWDNEKWPVLETCQYQAPEMHRRPSFLFNLAFFKMIALVTFSPAVCQLDTAIFPLSPLSGWFSFILKRHFTHGWL